MGFWGIGLYENDISLDVKDRFEEYFNSGKTPEEITEQMLIDFNELFDDSCESMFFWLVLSDIQWNHGILQNYVKQQALSWIEKASKTVSCLNESSSLQVQRKRVFDDLKRKLILLQPPLKKPQQIIKSKCEWNIGDVFAYKLESDLSKERGLFEKYFLIQKIDEMIWDNGGIDPIVYIKITGDNEFPDNLNSYNQLEYVQTGFTKYEERFLPIDGKRPYEDLAEKLAIKYEVDEFGFLPRFRVIIPNNTKRNIPKNLIYVGNFIKAIKPAKEFIPHLKFNTTTIPWKQSCENFETRLIRLYFNHNRRELSIYHKCEN